MAKPKEESLHFESLQGSIDSFSSAMSLFLKRSIQRDAEENLSPLITNKGKRQLYFLNICDQQREQGMTFQGTQQMNKMGCSRERQRDSSGCLTNQALIRCLPVTGELSRSVWLMTRVKMLTMASFAAFQRIHNIPFIICCLFGKMISHEYFLSLNNVRTLIQLSGPPSSTLFVLVLVDSPVLFSSSQSSRFLPGPVVHTGIEEVGQR